MRIRGRRPGDGEALGAVKEAAGRAAWSNIFPPDVLERLGFPARWLDEEANVLVAEEGGEVLGFAVVRASQDDDAGPGTGELDAFYTHPAVWGRGIGRALLAEATAVLGAMGFREATLWTAEENHRPRHVYERAGWSLDGASRARRLFGVEFVELRYRRRLRRGAPGTSASPRPAER